MLSVKKINKTRIINKDREGTIRAKALDHFDYDIFTLSNNDNNFTEILAFKSETSDNDKFGIVNKIIEMENAKPKHFLWGYPCQI